MEPAQARGFEKQLPAANQFKGAAVYCSAECRPRFDGNFRPDSSRLTLTDDDGMLCGTILIVSRQRRPASGLADSSSHRRPSAEQKAAAAVRRAWEAQTRPA